MIFETNKYQITTQNDEKLVITYNTDHLKLQIAILIGIELICFIVLWANTNSKQIWGITLSAIVILLFTLFQIIESIQLIKHGEEFIFNKSNNSIFFNKKLVGSLDKVKEIKIFEDNTDFESPTEYQLYIYLDNFAPIQFRKSTILNDQRAIGRAIAKLSNVPFSFQSELERFKFSQLPQKKIEYEAKVKLYEERYQERSLLQLKKIIEKDSPYAGYAKEAANNLLLRMINDQ